MTRSLGETSVRAEGCCVQHSDPRALSRRRRRQQSAETNFFIRPDDGRERA